MPVTDPSWFYSSMSQASAGIIGLMGGLLLSRLLQQLSVVRESRSQLVQDFVAIRTSAWSAQTFVQQHASYLVAQLPAMKKAFAEGQRSWQVGQWSSFRGSGSGTQVLVLADEIPKYERELVVSNEFLAAIDSVRQLTTLDDLDKQAAGLRQRSKEWPEKAKEWIDDLVPQLERLAHRCRTHSESVLPRNAVAMLGILGWLALSSVVLPLYFLVTEKGWGSQGFLLGAFSIGIVGLLLYLGLTVNDLRVAGQLQIPDRDRLAQANVN